MTPTLSFTSVSNVLAKNKFWTFEKGDIHILTKLLMGGANLDTPDEFGCTPLFSAAMQGKHECADLLCQRGANTNAFRG